MYDLIIVGGGVSAFGAAVYAGRFHMKTLIIGENFGGTLLMTDDIENYPGFEKITGMDLFENVKKHALSYGVEAKEQKVEKVEKIEEHFKVSTVEHEYETKTLLLATGSEWKKLGIPGEQQFTGNGVHYCALCDGYAYQDKVVAIVGGSDSAAKEAIMLTQYAKKVYIVYRGDRLKAEPINIKRVEENEKIEVLYDSNFTEILGDKVVNKGILDREYNGTHEFPVDGIFINIGHVPMTKLISGMGVEMTEKGEIKIDRYSKTNIYGLFAAGDCTDFRFKQAITGVAQGVAAVYAAYQCCTQKKIKV